MAAADHHGMHKEAGPDLDRLALRATLHCLSGCAVGEVLGMVIGTWLGLSAALTIVLAISLAFLFGYGFTVVPLLKKMPWKSAMGIALAADTLSIAVMEVVDNGAMLLIPGAMEAPLHSALFWGALAGSLILAGTAAYPINRILVARGVKHCH